MIDPKNAALAYFILRFGTGVNLLIHGWVRVGSGFQGFQAWMTGLFAESGLPSVLVNAMAYVIPTAELIFGAALILGLRTRDALVGAGLLIISLVFGMSLLQKWEIVGLQMTYLVIYFLLILFLKANTLSLDRIIGSKESV